MLSCSTDFLSQDGELREQFLPRTPAGGGGSSSGPGRLVPTGSAAQVVRQAPGAPVQVATATAEGAAGAAAAAGGRWSGTAAEGGRAAPVSRPTRALGALGVGQRHGGELS